MTSQPLRKLSSFDSVYADPPRRQVNSSCLDDLIAVLMATPGGLRRWSVMRAMRQRTEKANREVSPKFEDDVERVFRMHCERDGAMNGHGNPAGPKAGEALFYCPKERAGEVWAVYADRARAWQNGETV